MKTIREIAKYTFVYRSLTALVIVCNLLYVIFNLISLALFVPFLQIIFLKNEAPEKLTEPIFQGGFLQFFKYCSSYFEYRMYIASESNPLGALLFVCISVAIAFLLKNLFL